MARRADPGMTETITVEVKPDLSRWKAVSEALREISRTFTELERAFARAIETMESIDSTIERLVDPESPDNPT